MRSRNLRAVLPLLGLVACSDPPPAPAEAPSSTASAVEVASAPSPSPSPVSPPPPAQASVESKRFAAAATAFGLDFYRRLDKKGPNLAVSPASVAVAVTLAYGGAQGDTAAEIKRALHLDNGPEEAMADAGKLSAELQDGSRRVTLRLADRLFADKTAALEAPYVAQAKKAFGAGVELVDFARDTEGARAAVNGWVEQRTEKRIKELVPRGGVTASTRLVLVDAVYFLGKWDTAFEPGRTTSDPFSVSSSNVHPVPTMHRRGSVRFAASSGVKAVELPYQGGALSMLVILPDAIDGLAALEKDLTGARLETILRDLREQEVDIALPRFEIDPPDSLAVADVLQAMGVRAAFGDAADFTKISNPKTKEARFRLSQVFHKAFVKVDEAGTEAAAATALVAKGGGMPAPVPSFKADHPFLFVLRDVPTQLTLFVGRVGDPAAK